MTELAGAGVAPAFLVDVPVPAATALVAVAAPVPAPKPRTPIDPAAFYRGAYEASERARATTQRVTESQAAARAMLLGTGATSVGTVFAGVFASVGGPWQGPAFVAAVALALVGAAVAYNRQPVSSARIGATQAALSKHHDDLHYAAALTARQVLASAGAGGANPRLTDEAVRRLGSTVAQLEESAANLTSNERTLSAIAAAVAHLHFSAPGANEKRVDLLVSDVGVILDGFQVLAKGDRDLASRIAAEVALTLFEGPSTSYQPAASQLHNLPQHIFTDFRDKLLAYASKPSMVRYGVVRQHKGWLRAGERVMLGGIGPAVYRGVRPHYASEPVFYTMDGREIVWTPKLAVSRDGTRLWIKPGAS